MKTFYEKLARKLLLVTICVIFSIVGYSASYYVSNAGSDTNNGLSETSAWKTLAKVNSVTYVAGDAILFRRGDTFRGSVICKNAGTVSSNIVYGAYGTGNKPIISGFETISGWTNLGGGIYWASSTAPKTCNVLTVNGVNTPMGRFPKTGWLTFESYSGSSSITDKELTGTPNYTGAEVVIKKSNWTIDRSAITNHSGSTISYTSGSTYSPSSDGKYQYFIQKSLSALTQFGDWYCDGTKVYMYFGSTIPTDYVVKASNTDNIISDNGYDNIIFQDLAIEGSNTYGAYINLSENIKLQRCEFRNHGNHGIFANSSIAITVEDCIVDNCNGKGISISAVNSVLRNSKLNNCGYYAGMGAVNGASYLAINLRGDGSIIEYNEITNSGYIPVYYYGNNIMVRYNYINGFCTLMTDGGAIYTFWEYTTTPMTGTKVYNNIILNGGGNGLYSDGVANHIEFYNNTISGMGDNGIHMNHPVGNNIHDNTFYNCSDQAISIQNLWMYEVGASGNTIFSNTIVQGANTQRVMKLTDDRTYTVGNFGTSNNNKIIAESSTNNLYQTEAVQPSYFLHSYAESNWKTFSGQEANSTLTAAKLSEVQLKYNASKSASTISLDAPMVDVNGTKYSTSITLQPYTSVVLMKDLTPQTDSTLPQVTSFSIPSTSSTLEVPISAFSATDNIGVTGYLLTETATSPTAGLTGWALTTPDTYTFSSTGSKTLYAWAKDAAGNVSTSHNANVVISTIAAATTFTFTGPSSGNVNSTSSIFSVTPNNPFTGTITLTPSGTGSTGLSAIVLTFTNSNQPQTFTITPTVSGSIVMTPNNNGGLTNPVNIAYTVNPVVLAAPLAVAPDAPTSVVATAGNTTASVSFVAPKNNGGSAIIGYVVTSIPAGGIDNNWTSLTHSISGLINNTSYTFVVKAVNSVGESVASVTSNSVTPIAPLATTFTITGPSAGNVNSASDSFIVTPNSSYTGTISITTSGTGSAGLSPVVLTFSNSAQAQIFTINPSVAGSILLTPSNDGGLINPTSLTFTANAVVPQSPTSIVASAGIETASVTFEAPLNNGGSSITGYTVNSIPAGGIDINDGSTLLTHTLTGLTSGISYTFTVKANNIAGESVASVASNSVIPSSPVATSFTFTGPSSGNVNSASANFTVTPNNRYTGTITVTPSGTGSTGISSIVLTFNNSSLAQTFNFTPTTAGSIVLTTTNNSGLTNPAILTYTANAVIVATPVLTVPDAPTSVVATAGNSSATVSFVAPVNNGGSPISGYTVTSIPAGGVDNNWASLKHTITGLTNGTSYTFIVKAINSTGNSVASAASNSVMPNAPVATTFTFKGPSSGNVNSASASFTVTPNNPYTGTITITATGSGSTGIAARVLTFSKSSTVQTFSFTPTVAGSIVLTPTNNGGLANPANLSYNVLKVTSKRKSATIPVIAEETVHFQSNVDINTAGDMNISIVGLNNSGISIGDELAIFDGNLCVSAMKLTADQINNGSATLIASSSDDSNQNGFVESHSIKIMVWNAQSGEEYNVQSETINGKLIFEKQSSVLVSMKSLSSGISNNQELFQIDLYPNPCRDNVTVRFSNIPEAGSRIEIMDITGRKVESREINNTSEKFYLGQQPAGIYMVKAIIGNNIIVKKLIVN